MIRCVAGSQCRLVTHSVAGSQGRLVTHSVAGSQRYVKRNLWLVHKVC